MIPIGKIVLASAARTSGDNSGTLLNAAGQLPLSPAHIVLQLICTAFSGTQLDVALEHSADGGTTWTQHSSFASLTSTGERTLRFKNYHAGGDAAVEQDVTTGSGADANDGLIYRDHRIAWSGSGTGWSHTFAVHGGISLVERQY